MTVSYVNTAKTLHDIAQHAYSLGMGLQNVAPPQATAGLSIKYLVEMALKLEKASKEIEALLESDAEK